MDRVLRQFYRELDELVAECEKTKILDEWTNGLIVKQVELVKSGIDSILNTKYAKPTSQQVTDGRVPDNTLTKLVTGEIVLPAIVKPMKTLACILNSSLETFQLTQQIWSYAERSHEYHDAEEGDFYFKHGLHSPFNHFTKRSSFASFGISHSKQRERNRVYHCNLCISITHLFIMYMDANLNFSNLGRYITMDMPTWTKECDKVLANRRSTIPFSHNNDKIGAHEKASFLPALLLWFKDTYQNSDDMPVRAFDELWQEYQEFASLPTTMDSIELLGYNATAYRYIACLLLPRLDDYGFVNILNFEYTHLLRALRTIEAIRAYVFEVGYWGKVIQPSDGKSLLYKDTDLSLAFSLMSGARYEEFVGKISEPIFENLQAINRSGYEVPWHLNDMTGECGALESDPEVMYTAETAEILLSALMGHLYSKFKPHSTIPLSLGTIVDCMHLMGMCNIWRGQFLSYRAVLGLVQEIAGKPMTDTDLYELTKTSYTTSSQSSHLFRSVEYIYQESGPGQLYSKGAGVSRIAQNPRGR